MDRCIDLREEKVGAKVLVGDCDTADNKPFQRWLFQGGQIRNGVLPLYFDMRRALAGSEVLMSLCRRGALEFREFEQVGAALRNARSRFCLDLREDAHGAPVLLANCKPQPDGSSQHWAWSPSP